MKRLLRIYSLLEYIYSIVICVVVDKTTTRQIQRTIQIFIRGVALSYPLFNSIWSVVLCIKEKRFISRSRTFHNKDYIQEPSLLNRIYSNKSYISVSLQNCLEAFCITEKIEEKDKWCCKKCNKYTRAFKKIELFYLPKLFVIQLKRFISKGASIEKDNTFIYYPIK